MGESSELEEGEMTCSNDEAVVELGVDLSYIDKKVQSVLGHLQKDFGEGALDLFGPKICGYGSFLHCYNHLPAVPSCQRCSLGNHAVQRISNQLPGKNVVQNFQSLPTTSCEVGSNQDPQNYQTSGSLLAQSPAKVRLTKGTATIPTNDLSVRKPIRVRIKMGSEILSQKVARVCNDLGLDDSSISPSQQPSESPFRILQEMTAIPVPEDLLMLPLPDSLLTLPYNQPVIKARNKPLSQTQNKLSDIIGCEETLSGKRRKMVDCIDAITWNETSSIGEMKKKKVSSSGQQARDNSACRLGGASSTKDELTNERTMQEGMRKDGETVPRLAFTKSNKIKVVGMHAVKEKKTYPTKLQQSSSLDLDNWAQCDSCETCRLLSFGLKPEQLPEKWLCSMQTWLQPCSEHSDYHIIILPYHPH